jgi:hypothetical protein
VNNESIEIERERVKQREGQRGGRLKREKDRELDVGKKERKYRRIRTIQRERKKY